MITLFHNRHSLSSQRTGLINGNVAGICVFLLLLVMTFPLNIHAQEDIHAQEVVQAPDSAVIIPHTDSMLVTPIMTQDIPEHNIAPDAGGVSNMTRFPVTWQMPPAQSFHITAEDTTTRNGNIVESSYPLANDFNRTATIASWSNGHITGTTFHTTMPGLLSTHGVSLGLTHDVGRFSFSAGVSADRFYLGKRGTDGMSGTPLLGGKGFGFGGGVKDLYGISGSMKYSFNDNLSATIFGRYYNSFYHSMAAMPYIGTSSYGGFFTLDGGKAGIDLGVERRYDPYSRSWYMSPIVTPKIKISNKTRIEFPVGELLRHSVEKIFNINRSKGGPMIMPGRTGMSPIR